MADQWTNGLDEAIERMRQHVTAKPPVRFDARDRSALAFLIAEVERLRKPQRQWAVIFGDYYPREVDSLHDTREAAEKAAEDLGDGYEVEEMTVQRTKR